MKTHLDLFSGIGGFAIAAQACGYTTIGFCEKEPYAQQILKERFGAVLADAESSESRQQTERQRREDSRGGSGNRSGTATARTMPRLHPDIFTLNGADYAGVDLLTGGFPCQPFSVAGKRKGAADDRALWPEMLRVIDGAKPRWLIGENVAGIVTMELDNILSDLESLGYSAWPLVVPACAVDARHRRDRVWIVAHAARELRNGSGDARTCRRSEHSDSGEDVAYTASGKDDGRNGGSVDAAEGRREGQHAAAHARGKDVAHADSGRGEQRDNNERSLPKPDSECAGIGKDVAHADEPSRQGNERAQRGEPERADHQQHRGRQSQPSIRRVADGIPEGLDSVGEFCQWTEENPGTPRVSTGIKHRAHRLKGLGNSIVPNVAREIIQAIAQIESAIAA